MSEVFDELIPMEEDSFEKILLKMLDNEGVTTKTEIDKPLNLTKLHSLGVLLKMDKMNKCNKFINTFIAVYLEFQISKKRQSRKEVIQALTQGAIIEKTLAEKMVKKGE